MRTLMLFLLISAGVYAQKPQSLATIYANEYTNIALFFPSPVKQGITGGENFIFSFNENQAQHFGLLKGLPGQSSNLLVLTMDGAVYSYWLEYKEKISKVNYFIGARESIGNERSAIKDTLAKSPGTNEELDNPDANATAARMGTLENLSELYLRTSKGKIKSKRKKRLKLRVVDMIYNKNEVFMIFELENRSRIDFQLNYLNVYISQGSKRKNASFQKLQKEPVFEYEVPQLVESKDKCRFVYVFPKFTVGDNEKLEVEVRELKGNRMIDLKVKERRIRR